MAIEPIRNRRPVTGITFNKPPKNSIFLVWVFSRTTPAPKNSKPLNKAWLYV